MSVRRLARLLSARWRVLSLVAVVGLVSAMSIAAYANSLIEPRFRGEASVVLLTGDEESDVAFDGRLVTALARAQEANATALAKDPGLSVSFDRDSGELLFVAVSSSSVEAEALAAGLREAYVSAAPAGSVVEELEQALEETAAKVELLEEQITALGQSGVIDPDTTAKRGFLESQIAALKARAAALALDLAYPELAERDPEEINTELTGLETLLIRLNRDLEALPPEERDTYSSTDRLAKLALERRLRDHEARYLDLALQLAFLREVGGPSDTVVISDETLSPLPLPLAALAGFMAGAVVATAPLLLADRVRRPVWSMEDLETIPGLGVVPAGRPDASSIEPWYPTADPGPRRLALQGVRAALDGAVRQRPAAVAITGLRADSDEVHALAADLASAVAAAGNEVLLVDADFHCPSPLPEFGGDDVDLATVLAFPDTDSEATRSFVKEALVNLRVTETRLRGLSAGEGRLDLSDALAGRHFEVLVAEARGLVDMALMVAPGLGHPDADVVCSRLDCVLIVGRAGVTTELDIEEAVRSLDLRGAHPIGLVLIDRRTRRPSRSRSRHAASRRLTLLMQWRGRRETRSRPPREPVAKGSDVADLPTVQSSPVAPLDGETPPDGRSGRTKDVLTSRLLDFLDPEKRSSRKRHGVIPLVEGCGAPTARELLDPVLESWLSEGANGGNMDSDDLLGDTGGDTPQEALQSWLLDGFFAEHVATTEHCPVVWHVSSQPGAFQSLVYGPTFGLSAVRRIKGRHLGWLRRRLKRAMARTDDREDRYRLRRVLNELDEFDAALGRLSVGAEGWSSLRPFLGRHSSWPRARSSLPTDDVRARLAALQRLGLLPIDVLNEQELRDMTLPGA